MEKNLLIGFVSGKGGAGKSTVTLTVSNVINRYYNYKIAIIDTDTQKSIYNLRETEKNLIMNDESNRLKKAVLDLKQRGKKIYPVYSVEPTDLKQIAKIKNEHDITFIDMPGSLGVPGVKQLYFFLDYAFIPFYVDDFSYKSDLDTLIMVKGMYESKQSRLKNYATFFNRYRERTNKKQFDELQESFEKAGIKMLSPVYENIKYQREYCSSVKAIEDNMTSKSIHRLVESFFKIIENHKN